MKTAKSVTSRKFPAIQYHSHMYVRIYYTYVGKHMHIMYMHTMHLYVATYVYVHTYTCVPTVDMGDE